MLRVNVKPRHRNAPRIAEKSAPGFLQWLRGRECFFAYTGDCEGKIEAMHLDFAAGKGMATKVADQYAIAGCSGHHKRQTDRGWITFLKEVRYSKEAMIVAASRYWLAWPGRIAWERKLSDD